MPSYQRPDIPYNPSNIYPNNNRYALTSANNQSPGADDLDGEANYVIDILNELKQEISAIIPGNIPGTSDPGNVNKFPITDGNGHMDWSNVTQNYLADGCIPKRALQLGIVDEKILADGSVSNEKIQAGAIDNNNITDNKLLFDKINSANNDHFQEFFNTQDNGTLEGSKIKAGSLPYTTIADNSLPGTKISTNSLPAIKIANNSITTLQLSLVIQPLVGAIIEWTGDVNNIPAGYLLANGRAISRITYVLLFNVIGTRYGVGDGVTTFNIPDKRGVTSFGIDPLNASPTNGKIVNGTVLQGATGGSETVILNVNQIPSHTHGYSKMEYTSFLIANGGAANYISSQDRQTDPIGGGEAHNNMPPYMLNPFLIYAGV